MGELRTASDTPKAVVIGSFALLVVLVGGAIWAGQKVVEQNERATAGAPAPQPLNVGVPVPASQPPTVPVAQQGCADGCPVAGTQCVADRCRLRAGARCRLTPERVTLDGPAPPSPPATCLTPPRQERRCFSLEPAGLEGPFAAYRIRGASEILVGTEDLDRQSWDVALGGRTARAPSDGLLASRKLFDLGLLLRVDAAGSGVRFRITPVP